MTPYGQFGQLTRRGLLTVGAAAGVTAFGGTRIGAVEPDAELIVHNAKITTLDAGMPNASALLVRGEKFVAVGSDGDILSRRTTRTVVIDAQGHRVIPGLNDNHLHGIRCGLQYNSELRWDGVRSLKRALDMIREQVKRTPTGQWVRIMGGWSPYQFEERRLPSLEEINEASGATKVLVLFAYSKCFLNEAARAASNLTPATVVAMDDFEFGSRGGVIVSGSPSIYGVLKNLPALSRAEQLNSTQHFLRELNRFGVTSFLDPAATGVEYPDDYGSIAQLAKLPKFPIRISNFLVSQKANLEFASYENWTSREKTGINMANGRLTGFVLSGAGEVLLWSASDYEDFMRPQPHWGPNVANDLRPIVDLLVANNWPIRIHASYDETISKILGVFEPAFRSANYTARWVVDHAETIKSADIARIKLLGGGIAVQNRLAYTGEYFAERYGEDRAAGTLPLREILNAGVPLSAGTDGTRVASYNPWPSIYWFITRKTLGGKQFGGNENKLSREEALRAYTLGSAWISQEEAVKGRIAPGQYGDFAILNADYMTVPEDELLSIEAALTVVGGDIVYSAGPFLTYAADKLPAVTPSWSPVSVFGGYQI